MNGATPLLPNQSGYAGYEPEPDHSPGGQGVSLHQIVYFLGRNRLFLAIFVSLITIGAFVWQAIQPDVYRASTTVQVELNDSSGANQAEIAARNQQRVANEARIYRSPALTQQVVRDLRLHRDPRFIGNSKAPERSAIDYAASLLGTRTEVSSSPESDMIDLAVYASSPELAANIANQYIESLNKMRIKRRNSRKVQFEQALNTEQQRLEKEVLEAERQIAQFRASSRMLVGAGGAEDYSQINRIAVEAASASAMRDSSSARAAGVSSAVGNYSTRGETSALLQQQQTQYDTLQRERERLAVTYGAAHPDMMRVEAQMRELRENMGREQYKVAGDSAARAAADAAKERGIARADASGAAARANRLQAQLGALTSKAYSNTSNAVRLAELERKAEITRQAYLMTAKRAQDVKAELETTGVNSSLISAAVTPTLPVAPNPKRTALLAFIGSFALGTLLVFAKEMFDNKLRNADQIRRLFGLPTFAMLPEIANADAISAQDNPVVDDPQSLYAEAARTLANEVAAFAMPNETQTVLITSPLPGDGKSTVAITMVAAAASMGRRAVLVDLDLRRPTRSLLEDMRAKSGLPDLVDFLTGRVETKRLPAPQSAEPVSKDTKDLQVYQPAVLCTREPVANPTNMLRPSRVRKLVDDLSEHYDMIVINSPAILAVHDTRAFVGIADTTVMVANWGSTTVEQMRASLDLLHYHVNGVVFNKVDYADQARRGYGDSVQFYVDSAAYYSDVPLKGARSRSRFARWFGRREAA